MRISHAACETVAESLPESPLATVLGATAFRSYGQSQSHSTGGAHRPAATSDRRHGSGTAELVGAVSRELLLAVETDNRLTIYTDQRRGIFKIIIVIYIRIAPGLTTTTLKSDTISHDFSSAVEFCETVAQSLKSVIRIENSDLLRLGGSHFSVKLVFMACVRVRSRVLVSRDSPCE
jgi:hypothetical protein